MGLALKLIATLLALLVFVAWGTARIIANINYNVGIGGYISQAASSPAPSIAVAKLDQAIKEIERHGMTAGNTGILFSYPTNDVAFWYQRLVDSRKILRDLPANDSPLEISNTMIRVHETLVGQNKNGQHIVAPEGITIFPHNIAFFWWGMLSFVFACLFGALTVFDPEVS